MVETIKQMQQRHDKEISELQTTCKHSKISDWVNEYWAIAHGTGFQIKVCEICGKTVTRRTKCWKCHKLTENAQNGIGTNSRPCGSWYCEKCIERTPQEIISDNKAQKQTTGYIKAMKKFYKEETKPRIQS